MLEGEIEAANERTALELEEQNKKTEQNFFPFKLPIIEIDISLVILKDPSP